jgi:uncharacterized membrane protein
MGGSGVYRYGVQCARHRLHDDQAGEDILKGTPSPTSTTLRSSRLQVVDSLRGVAIGLMVVYHFCFDLNYFRVLNIDFNHETLWLGLRALIVSLFLGLVGVSLHLAAVRARFGQAFLRRFGLVAGCAMLVTLASAVTFPRSVIYFGVLHFIAVAMLLGRFMVHFYRANLVVGLVLLIVGLSVQHPVFDHPAFQWIGMMTHKPVTEDYVPLLPWFGVVLIGMFLGRTLCLPALAPVRDWRSDRSAVRALAFFGRHSLLIYMVHQPLLFAMLYLVLG